MSQEKNPQPKPMAVTPEQVQGAARVGLGVMQDPTTKVPMSSVNSGEATILVGLLTVLANGTATIQPAQPPEPTEAEKKAAKQASKKAKADAKKAEKAANSGKPTAVPK